METIFVWWVWAVIAIITLIAEVLLPSFTVGCFSVGALVAAVLSACGVGVNTQLIAFAVVSLLVFVVIRPFAVKYLLKKGKDAVATNQDALVGRVGRLTKAIEDPTLKGEVRIDGDIFPARSIDNSPIEAGEDVRVVRIDSIVMVVVPVK
ncbi:MAG: NfeD family protein [Flavobacteriales bacterium]|nr:NfeD family protein [Flavobacteriales bacterium]